MAQTEAFAPDAVALITGAASGIGAATAHRLRESGVVRLVLADRDAAGVERIAQALREEGAEPLPCALDVCDEPGWIALMERIAGLGRLDHVVANAGIAAGALLIEQSLADWRRVLSVNLDGVFLTLKHGLARMRAAAHGGTVVVVGSVAGLRAEPGSGAYSASKAAVLHLARTAAKESADARIRVNAIAPGGVETPIWRGIPFFEDMVKQLGSERAALDALGAGMPLGRYAKAEEIAGQIAFLLSRASAPMTGATLVVDSGYTV